MTDEGTTDRTYVCGPDCKAVKAEAEASWWKASGWVTKTMIVFGWSLIIASAVFGFLDVELRYLLHDWIF